VPRIFIGNFDFEHRLADPGFTPPAHLVRLNAEMAVAWLANAEEGDWLYTPEEADEAFFRRMQQFGFPCIRAVTSLDSIPKNVECVPWGWSSEIQSLAQRKGWSRTAPTLEAVRLANSRMTSAELERSWNVGLAGAAVITSIEDLHAAITHLEAITHRVGDLPILNPSRDANNPPAAHPSCDANKPPAAVWVLKSEYGMSGRERLLGQGPPTEMAMNWVRRRLRNQQSLFFEPWVERLSEVGIQIDIPKHGPPLLVGVARMETDERGQYAGSWFSARTSVTFTDDPEWQNAIETCLRAASHLQSLGYFGPVGIDAMQYRDNEGSTRIRPLQDINARWTMGRLSLGWRRFFDAKSEALWQHFSSASTNELPFSPDRIIPTSPETIGGSICHHQSRILVRG
jgi:hypothetical protein